MIARVPARTASLIGVPTDLGANIRGASMGPEALRVAGLPEALGRFGAEVRSHRGDAAVTHADVGGHARTSGSVDDGATTNDQVEHLSLINI